MSPNLASILTSNTKGTPITLIESNQYQEWLAQQNAFVQNYLAINPTESQAYSIIPDQDGNLARILVLISNLNDFYLAGDLPASLPPGHYTLDCSALNDTDDTGGQSLALRFAISWGLASYHFDRYKPAPATASLGLDSASDLKAANDFISAISLTRDLINTPASDMMPEHMAATTEALAEEFGAEFSQVVGDALIDENYPMIHAVGRASVHSPRLLDLKWGDENAPKITLVGKGVCFDSGGLNIKTGNFMRLMKKDMGGAAHVLGLARLIMAHQLPVRLRVLIPAVENAVSSNAFRPGDVINTRQGISVEIDNTDAEGRLVLCDALSEADREKPDLVVDFATLTGACRVALGTELPGFFCNHINIATNLFSSGEKSKDPVWQLPLHAAYQDMLKSDVADTLNSASSGFDGAITAALYLQLFISDQTPWVHFDVMAWNNRKLPGRPVGGEAFGLRAVFLMLQERYGHDK